MLLNEPSKSGEPISERIAAIPLAEIAFLIPHSMAEPPKDHAWGQKYPIQNPDSSYLLVDIDKAEEHRDILQAILGEYPELDSLNNPTCREFEKAMKSLGIDDRLKASLFIAIVRELDLVEVNY